MLRNDAQSIENLTIEIEDIKLKLANLEKQLEIAEANNEKCEQIIEKLQNNLLINEDEDF